MRCYHRRTTGVELEHVCGRCAQFPNHSEPGKRAQCVMRNIKLPPIESLPLRRLIMVMIVMPTLTERDQRDKPVIAAVVVGRKPALAENMRQRVNSKSAVIEDHCTDEESANQHLWSRGA